MNQPGEARLQSEGMGEGARLPLSDQQLRWWHFNEVYGTARCQTRLQLEFRGRLDRQALRAAFERLISRHDILRARFQLRDGLATQYFAPCAEALSFIERDVDGGWRAEQLCKLDGQEQLSLENGPLIRGYLLRLPDHAYVLLIVLHPIICDGPSLGRMVQELLILYKEALIGGGLALHSVTPQYHDYVRADLREQPVRSPLEQLGRWRELGRGWSRPWPASRVGPAATRGVTSNEHVCVEASRELTRKLRDMARDEKLKPCTALLAAWAGVFLRCFETTTAVFGIEAASQRRSEEVFPVGPLVDLVPLELGVQASTTVLSFLHELDRAVRQSLPSQENSWERVSDTQGTDSRVTSVIPVAFDINTKPCLEELASSEVPGLTFERVSTDRRWPCAAISVSLDDRGPVARTTLCYSSSSMGRGIVESLGGHWLLLLEAMTSNCHELVRDLPPAEGVERKRGASGSTDAVNSSALHTTVTGLFEEQVQKTPDSVAVEHEGRRLTYQQLNRKANQLARSLVNRGVCATRVVAICVDRSLEMVIGLLGILKAGGAYLPLDPNYPTGRLEQMLEDAKPELLITETELIGVLPSGQRDVIAIDQELTQIAGFVDEDLDSRLLDLGDNGLVYVIYTSGSTGRPKGIAMHHRAMVNLIEWQRESLDFPVAEQQRVLQFASLSFDVAFQEIFSTLCTGGTLVLIDEWIRRDANALVEFLIKASIQRLFVPPVMLHSIAHYCEAAGIVPRSLRDVITAGEQLRLSSATRKLFSALTGCKLHNHYGPAETHVVTSWVLAGDPREWPDLPPIGKPITNAQIHLLDEERKPVPTGRAGEIYIGGICVSRGYLGQPELTAERFIRDLPSTDDKTPLYKTGDVGRCRADGALEYLGRNDDQVKIRGFRIELAEIEVQLARHEKVLGAVVVAREDDPAEKRLVAYVVLRGNAPASVSELRAHLQQSLPEYMVPGAFVVMQSLPVTPSGKVDRRALPPPTNAARVSSSYEPPRTATEKLVAVIWQEVLNVGAVGRNDDFFELGGHSLVAMQLVARLRGSGLFGDPMTIYLHPTLAEFTQAISKDVDVSQNAPPNRIPQNCDRVTPDMLPLVSLEPSHIERIAAEVPGGASNIQDIYPLAPLQEGILFHHLLNRKGGDTYVVPMLFSLSSHDTLRRFTLALRQIIDRHDILRTAVLWEGLPEPVQVVYRKAILEVEQLVLSEDEDPMIQLRSRLRPEAQRLELNRAPLMRLYVARPPNDARWFAVLQIHHLIQDHESEAILLNEVSSILDGNGQELCVPVPYRDRVARSLAEADSADLIAYFRDKLGDLTEPTAPYGLMDVYGDGRSLMEVAASASGDLSREIRSLSRQLRVSAAAVFHATWALVLSCLCSRNDVVFGTLVTGRTQAVEYERRTIGSFINTLPVRVSLEGKSARRLLEGVHRSLGELLQRERASLAMVQGCSGVAGAAPLFTALLNYRYASAKSDRERWRSSGFELLEMREWTNYPVVFTVDDEGEGFSLTLQTDRRIDANRMMGYVRTTLESLVRALQQTPEVQAKSLRVLPEAEWRQIVAEFNATTAEYPNGKGIHELFEEQAERSPNAVAIECEGRSLSYAELDEQATLLAGYLRECGVGPDRLVGICVERSVEMVVGLLGILKAGGAYVPLDPGHPGKRLAYMLEDAAPGVVLTQQRLKEMLPKTDAKVIAIDDGWKQSGIRDSHEISNERPRTRANQLAYVIYTSGSTGRPKGVMIEHRSVVNFLHSMQRRPGISIGDRLLAVTTVTFDIAALEIFLPLVSGATIVLARGRAVADPKSLAELLNACAISIMQATPTTWKMLLDGGWVGRNRLKALCGGEVLTADLAARLTKRVASLWNLYGPTETTIWSAARQVMAVGGSPTGESIGNPIQNTRIYILDGNLQPLPIGVSGELYIGGVGVARGYLNRAELTAERFLPDQLSCEPGARMYRTGDLGRWISDGTIEYLGRDDHQVKVRGVRIELGEIEARLVNHPCVKEALVIAREDASGEKRLIAYWVGNEPGRLVSAADLRAYLTELLPEYMLPSAFVSLEAMPLTPNGKLDRRALPAPELSSYASREYEAPRGEVEEILASIWQELLGVTRIGRTDSFFEVGGNSLLAMRVVAHVNHRLGVDVPLRLIFDDPRFGAMASFVSREMTPETLSEAS